MGLHLSIDCDVCGNDDQFDDIEDLQWAIDGGDWEVCSCGSVACEWCELDCECEQPHPARRSVYRGHPNRARALAEHAEAWTRNGDTGTRAINTEPCPACGQVHYAR